MKTSARINVFILIQFTLALLCLSCASYQSVSFKSAPVTENSLVLKGNLYKPEGKGRFPAVVVLHGCAGIDYHFRAWAEQLVEWGYVAIIVDSFRPRGVDRVCGKSYRVPDLERAADAYGAAIYLKQLPYVDSENIGLMGFSHGGWTGLRAVQRNFSYTVNMETNPFKAAVLFYPSCYYAHDQYIAIPTLILIGSKDDWTPAHRCVELDKVVSNPEMLELVVYDGAYHDFDRPKGNREYLGHTLKYDAVATKDAKERTKDFFDRYLMIK
jgi:dienelactone hydrolase